MALLAYLMLTYLLLYKEGESLLLGTTSIWAKLPSTILFIVLVALVLFSGKLPLAGRSLERALVPFSFGASLLFSFAVILFQSRYFGRYGYRLEPTAAALLGLSSLATLAAAVAWARWQYSSTGSDGTDSHHAVNRPFMLLLAATGVTALGYWTAEILSFPLDPQRSNMLPVIEASARTLLSGSNPYRFYEMAGGTWPLNYLPGLWLPYVPLLALGLDPRWLSPPSLLLLAGLLSRLSRGTSSATHALVLSGSVLLNPYFLLRHEAYTYLFLLLVALFCASMLWERRAWSSILFGVILASRQTFLPLLPFYLWTLFTRKRLVEPLVHLLVVGSVAASIVLPFVLANHEAFRASVIDWHQTALGYSYAQAEGLLTTFNLSIFLFRMDLGSWLQMAQGGALVLSLLFAAPFVRSPLAGLRAMSIALLVFLLLNPVVWTYLYMPLLVLLAFVVIGSERRRFLDSEAS